jgi:hypothetical protein
MNANRLRLITTVAALGVAILLGAGAMMIGPYRDAFVYAPRERAAEDAVKQVAERQKALHKSTGKFVSFGAGDVDRDQALLGLNWANFPVKEFAFDAESLDGGNLRLRALPRPDLVSSLAVKPRAYIAELSADGAMVRAGWFPSI